MYQTLELKPMSRIFQVNAMRRSLALIVHVLHLCRTSGNASLERSTRRGNSLEQWMNWEGHCLELAGQQDHEAHHAYIAGGQEHHEAHPAYIGGGAMQARLKTCGSSGFAFAYTTASAPAFPLVAVGSRVSAHVVAAHGAVLRVAQLYLSPWCSHHARMPIDGSLQLKVATYVL
mmetsp:Transcript_32264/g.57032  ORF Transcript_32264/g.57032 Transcript_32264/m.57032 type:complete len:174 (+) Transcript_32264:1135-1656(+)